MDKREIELRILAKRFKKELGGYAKKLPDWLINGIKDSEVGTMYRILYSLRVYRIKSPSHLWGFWENPHCFSPSEHERIEDIMPPPNKVQFPKITQLLQEGRGWIEDGSVMGMTADGPVCLGPVNEDTDRYLADHPKREDW